MFKVGDKVVCIRYEKMNIDFLDKIFHLDVGKTYIVTDVNDVEIKLFGKQKVVYNTKDFILLNQYRKEKIKKIQNI